MARSQDAVAVPAWKLEIKQWNGEEFHWPTEPIIVTNETKAPPIKEDIGEKMANLATVQARIPKDINISDLSCRAYLLMATIDISDHKEWQLNQTRYRDLNDISKTALRFPAEKAREYWGLDQNSPHYLLPVRQAKVIDSINNGDYQVIEFNFGDVVFTCPQSLYRVEFVLLHNDEVVASSLSQAFFISYPRENYKDWQKRFPEEERQINIFTGLVAAKYDFQSN